MAIRYNISRRVNPKAPHIPHYGARISSTPSLSLDDMIRELCVHTTLDPYSTRGALLLLSSTIERYLSNGYIVNLGDLGTMRLKICAKMVSNPAEWKQSNIRKVSVKFAPGKKLREAYKNAQFVLDGEE